MTFVEFIHKYGKVEVLKTKNAAKKEEERAKSPERRPSPEKRRGMCRQLVKPSPLPSGLYYRLRLYQQQLIFSLRLHHYR